VEGRGDGLDHQEICQQHHDVIGYKVGWVQGQCCGLMRAGAVKIKGRLWEVRAKSKKT
jgi:hypothetical protein